MADVFPAGSSGEVNWDDLRFPASGINPAGAISPPSVDNVEASTPGTLLFSGSADNLISCVAQMPHRWQRGTDIKPHIHWSKPTGSASAVTWEMYYKKLGSVGDVAGAWTGPVSGSLVAGDPTVSDNHCITSFGAVSMAGLKESAMVAFRIYRRGSTDADNGTARLLEFDIHYKSDKPGTIQEIPT